MQETLPMVLETQAPTNHGPGRARGAGLEWRIDARTRRAGLRGVAAARAALDATRSRHQQGQPDAA